MSLLPSVRCDVYILKTLRFRYRCANVDESWLVYSMGQDASVRPLLGSRILNCGPCSAWERCPTPTIVLIVFRPPDSWKRIKKILRYNKDLLTVKWQTQLCLFAGVGVDRWKPQGEFPVRARRMRLPRRNQERHLAAILGTRCCGFHEVRHREDSGPCRWLDGPSTHLPDLALFPV